MQEYRFSSNSYNLTLIQYNKYYRRCLCSFDNVTVRRQKTINKLYLDYMNVTIVNVVVGEKATSMMVVRIGSVSA